MSHVRHDALQQFAHDLNILLSDYEHLKVEISISNEDDDEVLNLTLKSPKGDGKLDDLKNNLLRKLNI